MVGDALLRYLAVAHYGRGRGEYEESEHPAFWRTAVMEMTERRALEIRALWEKGRSDDVQALSDSLKSLLTSGAAELLVQFYPDARELLAKEAGALPHHASRPEGRRHRPAT
jgi:hypothetical protein